MKLQAVIGVLTLVLLPASGFAQTGQAKPAQTPTTQTKPAAPAATQATDLTGTWNATFTRTAPSGQTQQITFTFHFTQKGKVLTGTIGPEPARQWPVEKGVVAGNKVTFQVQQPEGPLRTFTLTLEKGHLKGPQKLEFNGQTADVEVDAVKAPVK